MTDNKYKGEVQLDLCGEPHTLVFDWNALGILKTRYTDDNVTALLNGNDLDIIADVMAIGLQKHHKGITKDYIAEASPPFMVAVSALNEAILYAYFGPAGPPEDDEDEADQKKTKAKTTPRKKKRTK